MSLSAVLAFYIEERVIRESMETKQAGIKNIHKRLIGQVHWLWCKV